MDHPQRIYTVGHSNHSREDFFQLLTAHGIDTLVDVRSSPYSKYSDQYNKREFEHAAREAGFVYLYLGSELGGMPKDPAYYDAEGYVRYDRIAATPEFKAGVGLLVRLAKGHAIALVCSEEDPTECHRRRLIGRVLTAKGVDVAHIRADGGLTPEREFAAGLAPRIVQLSLFGDQEPVAWKSSRSVSPKNPPPSSLED